jgi:uncharacterized lipoprotein
MKKMTQMFWFIPIMAILGCSTQYEFTGRTTDANREKLKIPAGLSGTKIQDAYPIPMTRGGAQQREKTVSLLPPGSRIAEY